MRGVHLAFILTGALYFSVAATGYWALGSAAGPNIILSLANGPAWARIMARLMVVVHVGAAYQVYAHPAFEAFESFVGGMFTDGRCCCGGIIKIGYDDGGWFARLVLRSAYVAGCTAVACVIPFFGELMGLIGAVAITPTTFLLPALLYLFWRDGKRGFFESAFNWAIVLVTGAIGAGGAVASVYTIVHRAKDFQFFNFAT